MRKAYDAYLEAEEVDAVPYSSLNRLQLGALLDIPVPDDAPSVDDVEQRLGNPEQTRLTVGEADYWRRVGMVDAQLTRRDPRATNSQPAAGSSRRRTRRSSRSGRRGASVTRRSATSGTLPRCILIQQLRTRSKGCIRS